jgi:hypothetical protein
MDGSHSLLIRSQQFGTQMPQGGHPPHHSITSSCFGVEMTRSVNEQNICTPQRVENRACNDPRILTTNMKPISCGLPSMRVMCLEYSIRN